jgi:hypothetical protein
MAIRRQSLSYVRCAQLPDVLKITLCSTTAGSPRVLNAKPAQNLVTLVATSWLRPTIIVPPRLPRVGATFEW